MVLNLGPDQQIYLGALEFDGVDGCDISGTRKQLVDQMTEKKGIVAVLIIAVVT